MDHLKGLFLAYLSHDYHLNFFDICNIKFSECKHDVNYTSHCQVVYDKIFGLIEENSTQISKKTVELTLQGNFLKHLGKDYLALVTSIKTKQNKKTISLTDTVLKVVKYIEINKENKKNKASSIFVNALAIKTQ